MSAAAMRLKFDSALAECRLHAAVLGEAAVLLPFAFDAKSMAQIDSNLRRSLDQAAYRFMKLQDTLGEKVLPGILVRQPSVSSGCVDAARERQW